MSPFPAVFQMTCLMSTTRLAVPRPTTVMSVRRLSVWTPGVRIWAPFDFIFTFPLARHASLEFVGISTGPLHILGGTISVPLVGRHNASTFYVANSRPLIGLDFLTKIESYKWNSGNGCSSCSSTCTASWWERNCTLAWRVQPVDTCPYIPWIPYH